MPRLALNRKDTGNGYEWQKGPLYRRLGLTYRETLLLWRYRGRYPDLSGAPA
jgi:hypothetical protein